MSPASQDQAHQPIPPAPPPGTRKSAVWSRFGASGDLPARFFRWGVAHCPCFLEPLFLYFYSALTLLLFHKGRRAALKNLRVIRPQDSGPRRLLRAWGAWRAFGWTQIDTMHVKDDGDVLNWLVEGKNVAERLDDELSPGILLTAHMGSYDIAGHMFCDRLKVPVLAVRAPLMEQKAQEFHSGEFASTESATMRYAYNQKDGLLGVELLKALSSGKHVALQGDRVLLHVSGETVPWNDEYDWKLPIGPFVLAFLGRVKIWPLFMLRTGYRSYRMIFVPPYAPPAGRVADKQLTIHTLRDQWAAILRPLIEAHPEQWMVYEEAFVKRDKAAELPSEPKPVASAEEESPTRHFIPATIPPRPGLVATVTSIAAMWHFWISWSLLAKAGLGSVTKILLTPLCALFILHVLTILTSMSADIVGRFLPAWKSKSRHITTMLWLLAAGLLSWAVR